MLFNLKKFTFWPVRTKSEFSFRNFGAKLAAMYEDHRLCCIIKLAFLIKSLDFKLPPAQPPATQIMASSFNSDFSNSACFTASAFVENDLKKCLQYKSRLLISGLNLLDLQILDHFWVECYHRQSHLQKNQCSEFWTLCL